MPRFAYTVVDDNGRESGGSVDAPDVQHLTATLRAQGLFPIKVAATMSAGIDRPPVTPGFAGSGISKQSQKLPRASIFRSRIRARERATFTRQLATLLHAGMPLLRSLEVLGRQERNASLRRLIAQLGAAIKAGGTLSDAMAQHPRMFDRLAINMVRAGEAGGVLEVVLERLAQFQEKSLQLRGKISAAMVYPLIVLAVAVLILAGLLVFVVPRFQQIFADLLRGAPLPTLTQWVLAISKLVKDHAFLEIVAGLMVWGGFMLVRKTRRGARTLDAGLVRLPVFGPLLLKAIVARFGRTLGTLLASGVPLLPALLLTRDTCDNHSVADAITRVHDEVKAGAPVARPLEETRAFPPMVASMVDVGEHTGRLPEMLNKIAEIHEVEVDNAVAGLSSLIEPLLILFLALVVGIIVVALFLPIVRIVQLLS